MIKGIAGGRYINVQNGSPSSTYINSYAGILGAGNVRYNPAGQNLEVYDGNNWVMLSSSYSTVELTHEAQSLLDWAATERQRQQQYEELAKKHPAVADALESVKDAELKLRELSILCQESESE